MKCPKCGKEIEPLTLTDGRWGCGECHEIITNAKFRVTRDNLEMVTLSRIYYSKALELSKENDIKRIKREYDYYINQAIKYAQEAVRLDNPEAYMLMGYYNDFDYTNVKEEVVRCKMATPYYLAVINANFHNDVRVEVGDLYKLDDFEKLQTKTANLFANMINSMSYVDKINYGLELIEKYSADLEAKHIKINVNGQGSSTNMENILEMMASNSKHAPIYAAFLVDKETAKNLNINDNIIRNNRNILIYGYKVGQDNRISTSKDDTRRNLRQDFKSNLGIESRKSNSTSLFEGEKRASKVYITIYNDKSTINKRNYKNLTKAYLYNSENELVKFYNSYLNEDSHEYDNSIDPNFIFYEDDLLFATNEKKLYELLKNR